MVDNTSALFARLSSNSDRIILPVNDSALVKGPPRNPFYCVHSVSGAAGTDFVELAGLLDPTVQFYGIQAPAKKMQDVNFGSSLEALAETYVEALVAFQPTGPLLLGGYCVGAVIAFEMARMLRQRGRNVGPLIVIDGVPENTGISPHRWRPDYWIALVGKLPGWIKHADLMRNMSLRSLLRSLSTNAIAIGKRAIGRTPYEKLLGGYSIEGVMDLSNYPEAQRAFINRLLGALFDYVPGEYAGDVVVYEAKTTPLLFLPRIGYIWQRFTPRVQVESVLGTHIAMLHKPYVNALADDLHNRILRFYSSESVADVAAPSEPRSSELDPNAPIFTVPR
jgi:thioesterase domain-containing protein